MKKISCFSYKGGAGRTTLALNVVPYLADKLKATAEHPLILVDMDIDSCGTTYFLNLENYENIDRFSTQAMFGSFGSVPRDDDAETVRDHTLFRHLCPVGEWFNFDPYAILCLPAEPGGKLGANNYDDKRSEKLREFVDECETYECCGILFDSAVGDQLTAAWSNYYSDYIMCCMRPTKQFREGTQRFFDKFDESLGRGKKIIVIPNVVPTESLSIEDSEGVHNYPDYAKTAIIKSFEDNVERNMNEYNLEMLEGKLFGIPKIDRFMWQEGILSTASKLTETERVALERYKKIAEIICRD